MSKYIILLTAILLFACQEGLVPDSSDKTIVKTILSGKITYVGGLEKFPDSSKCFGIYVAAFKFLPKDTSGIMSEILAGNVYLKFESQPYPVESSLFEIEIPDAPMNLEYIVVSMKVDSAKIDAQIPIGVYTATGDNTKPTAIYMNKGDSTFINIIVDFDNLPPISVK